MQFRGLRKILTYTVVDRRHHLWRSRYLYTFHWGLARTSERYAPAGRLELTP